MGFGVVGVVAGVAAGLLGGEEAAAEVPIGLGPDDVGSLGCADGPSAAVCVRVTVTGGAPPDDEDVHAAASAVVPSNAASTRSSGARDLTPV